MRKLFRVVASIALAAIVGCVAADDGELPRIAQQRLRSEPAKIRLPPPPPPVLTQHPTDPGVCIADSNRQLVLYADVRVDSGGQAREVAFFDPFGDARPKVDEAVRTCILQELRAWRWFVVVSDDPSVTVPDTCWFTNPRKRRVGVLVSGCTAR